MPNKVSIIMYHYVRDLKKSKYPGIKGLDLELFKNQIQYILKYYKVIRMEDLIGAVKKKKKLVDNSILLTFDDGYKDHFQFVFPILDKLGIQGSFFSCVEPVKENKVLDVNKIHFILASVNDKKKIISDIYDMLNEFRKDYSLKTNRFYYNKLAKDGKFDTKDVVFIKKMLQKELPQELRSKIIGFLFNKYVSEDERLFSGNLYMNTDELKFMKEKGMYIGTHGNSHCFLSDLSKEEQQKEIKTSLDFLNELSLDREDWAMSYPYGDYNDSLISIIKQNGCKVGLTTKADVADLNKHKSLLLPRLDTNELLTK